MADMTLTQEAMTSVVNLCHNLTQLPILPHELHIRYDQEADVMYILFDKDAKIYLSRDGDDGILWEHDRNDRLVGVTILDASTRAREIDNKVK